MRMSGMPAWPMNSAYRDHSQAASVPTLISVSMVAAPCLRLAQAALWNGQAPHRTTGVARFSASHCQLSNCRAGTMETTRTGSESAALTSTRRRSAAVSSSGSGAAAVSSPGTVGSVAS